MQQLVDDLGKALRAIDESAEPFKSFRPGVGPYGEPQVLRKSVEFLTERYPDRFRGARTKREPDVLIPGRWAIEVKIVRPFGDNGVEAEHWSQNLLHPYEGNVSAIGDALKLLRREGSERRGVVVIGFEHSPPQINMDILIAAFEIVAQQLLRIPLGRRCVVLLDDLIHPVHQRARVFGWEVGEAPDPTTTGGPASTRTSE